MFFSMIDDVNKDQISQERSRKWIPTTNDGNSDMLAEFLVHNTWDNEKRVDRDREKVRPS